MREIPLKVSYLQQNMFCRICNHMNLPFCLKYSVDVVQCLSCFLLSLSYNIITVLIIFLFLFYLVPYFCQFVLFTFKGRLMCLEFLHVANTCEDTVTSNIAICKYCILCCLCGRFEIRGSGKRPSFNSC